MNKKVMLVAIAKDEAAFLSDWIFHHLYFGFDKIAIYVNNTSDPTNELKKALKELPEVKFYRADWYFLPFYNAPQIAIYNKALSRARKAGFSHVLFLDIDEFWTPLDFSTSVKQYIDTHTGDVFSFEWMMKNDEPEPYAFPFGIQNNYERARHVKSLFKTDLTITGINPHNVTANNADYRLADGSYWPSLADSNYKVPSLRLMHSIPNYFILHRYCRSQLEYISLLGRGRPQKTGSIFKDNRSGYPQQHGPLQFTICGKELATYKAEHSDFIARYGLEDIVAKAHRFISNRYRRVLETITNAPLTEAPVLAKLLNGVTDINTLEAYGQFCKAHGIESGHENQEKGINGDDVLVLRKAAFQLAENHPQLALSVLMILKKSRPCGKIINTKINELKRKLNIR